MSYVEEFEDSVRDYWRVRTGQRRRQEERGVVDIGGRTETTGGQQMKSLTQLVAQVFVNEGFPEESVRFEGVLDLRQLFHHRRARFTCKTAIFTSAPGRIRTCDPRIRRARRHVCRR
jgi:hypothetical protein